MKIHRMQCIEHERILPAHTSQRALFCKVEVLKAPRLYQLVVLGCQIENLQSKRRFRIYEHAIDQHLLDVRNRWTAIPRRYRDV